MAQVTPADRQALLNLILDVSFERKEVTLASGKKSNFYLDLRQTLMRPKGVSLAGRLVLERLHGAAQEAGWPTQPAQPQAGTAAGEPAEPPAGDGTQPQAGDVAQPQAGALAGEIADPASGCRSNSDNPNKITAKMP